jgi:hypothetical protein
MVETHDDVLTDISYLPPDGTSERLEWDRTIREAGCNRSSAARSGMLGKMG